MKKKWKLLTKTPKGIELYESEGQGFYSYAHTFYEIVEFKETNGVTEYRTRYEYGEPYYLHEHPESYLALALLPLFGRVLGWW